MRAGSLDRVIAIIRATHANDSYSSPVYTWTELVKLRAQIVHATTEEVLRTWGASSETAIIFRTRYLAGLLLSDRVVYDGSAHYIKEVKELGRRRGLEIRTVRAGA